MRIAITTFVGVTLSLGLASQGTIESEDCRALKLMSRMARIAASSSRDVVTGEMQKVCVANDVQKTRTWSPPAKGSMKMAGGTWYYPLNGGRAIDSRSLYYPAAGSAKVGETWYYPKDGGRARSAPSKSPRAGDPAWYRPRGASTTEQRLHDWACQRLGVEQCSEPLADVRAATGDEKVLAVIELAWTAYNVPPR